MQNTSGLSVEDFLNKGRSLNFSGFKNSDMISKAEYDELSKANIAFTQETINEYISDVSKSIKQGDTEFLEKAKTQVSSLTRKILANDKGNGVPIYFMPKDKADELSADFFSKAEISTDEDSIEKAKSIQSLKYDSSFKFKKTGKEIKQKVEEAVAMIDSTIVQCQADMAACIKNVTIAPDQNLSEWETEGCGSDCDGLKKFSWECCSYDGGNYKTVSQMAEFGATSKSTSKEEADLCRNYNNSLDKFLRCKKDKELALTFVRNIDEAKSYDLSLEQLTNLNF